MKLYRFTAASNHRAIIKVHDSLGPDALIYTTRKIPEGVEILAGLPETQESTKDEIVLRDKTQESDVRIENSSVQHLLIEHLNSQIQIMDENIQALTNHIHALEQMMIGKAKKKRIFRWNPLRGFFRSRKMIKEGAYEQQPAL